MNTPSAPVLSLSCPVPLRVFIATYAASIVVSLIAPPEAARLPRVAAARRVPSASTGPLPVPERFKSAKNSDSGSRRVACPTIWPTRRNAPRSSFTIVCHEKLVRLP